MDYGGCIVRNKIMVMTRIWSREEAGLKLGGEVMKSENLGSVGELVSCWIISHKGTVKDNCKLFLC